MTDAAPIPRRADIEAAAARIAGHLRETPVLTAAAGTFGLPCHLAMKLEHTQLSGSFKIRGAFNNLLAEPVPDAGVVAFSGGNHGAAVALAATALGHASVIYVPAAVSRPEKVARMRGFGAEVIEAEGSVTDVLARYEEHAARTGARAIHPYDTMLTVAGQGTVAREIEAEAPLDTLIVSTGGGGLIGGVAAWYAGRTRIVSSETEGTATLARTLADGPGVTIAPSGVAAGSLGGPSLGVVPQAVVSAYIADACVVSDAEVYRAGQMLWEETRLVVEPAAAVALAVLTSGAYTPQKDERVGILLCGGNAAPDWFVDPGTA